MQYEYTFSLSINSFWSLNDHIEQSYLLIMDKWTLPGLLCKGEILLFVLFNQVLWFTPVIPAA
jgi:hypothetical protein